MNTTNGQPAEHHRHARKTETGTLTGFIRGFALFLFLLAFTPAHAQALVCDPTAAHPEWREQSPVSVAVGADYMVLQFSNTSAYLTRYGEDCFAASSGLGAWMLRDGNGVIRLVLYRDHAGRYTGFNLGSGSVGDEYYHKGRALAWFRSKIGAGAVARAGKQP